MSRRKAHLIITVILLSISAGMIGWTFWPLSAGQSRVFIRPNVATLPGASNPPPAVLDPRILTLLWPHSVRLGDAGRISLDFVRDPADSALGRGDTPQSGASGFNVMVDARLEMPDARIVPLGLVSQTMLPGQPIHFEWQVAPYEPGDVDGTVWVYLRYVAADSGEQQQVLIAVKPVRVRSVALLGLPAGVVRAAGWVGIVAGIILGLPFFDETARRMWMRTRP